jgi:hypothetical protein
MNTVVRLLSVLGTVLVAGAFSGAVAQSPAAPSVKATTTDASAAPLKTVLVDDTVTDTQLKQILAKGYRPTKQEPGHEVAYCRRENLVGGRFDTRVCKTARQILEQEQRGRDTLEQMQRISLQAGK